MTAPADAEGILSSSSSILLIAMRREKKAIPAGGLNRFMRIA